MIDLEAQRRADALLCHPGHDPAELCPHLRGGLLDPQTTDASIKLVDGVRVVTLRPRHTKETSR